MKKVLLYITFRLWYIVNTFIGMFAFGPYWLFTRKNYFKSKYYVGPMEWLDKRMGLKK